MSAYVVSHATINAILTFAAPGPTRRGAFNLHWGKRQFHFDNPDDLQEMATILLKENERSVQTRYPDTVMEPTNMPGLCAEVNTPITFCYDRDPAHLTPVVIIKLCHCLEYQSCETDDWKETLAYRIVEHIESHAINSLPGYDKAPWGLD